MAILIRGKTRGGLRNCDSAGNRRGHPRIIKPVGHNYQHKTVKGVYRHLAEKCGETARRVSPEIGDYRAFHTRKLGSCRPTIHYGSTVGRQNGACKRSPVIW